MRSDKVKDLAIQLTVELTEVCDNIRGRDIFIKQILRSCSSIGANSSEATYSQSNADFINKLEIALKECYETEYWLEILAKVKAISEKQYDYFRNSCGTIRRKLIAAIKKVKK